MTAKQKIETFHVDRLDLNFAPKPWPYAIEHAEDIKAYFAERQRELPALWNGQVLVTYRTSMADGVFRGDFLQTDYASFTYWHSRGQPEAGISDCFAAAGILGADGAFLLGVMGDHTYNRGRIYFPCGTPDLSDIRGGKVDLEFNVERELKEETGLDVTDFSAEPGWAVATEGPLTVHIKVLRARETAALLRQRILDILAREKQPELADIRIVRDAGDFDQMMPDYIKAFMAQRFAGK